MKKAWWVAGLVALASGCTCGEKRAPDAGVPDAGRAAAAPVMIPEAVKLVREADSAFQAGRLDEAIEKSEAALRQVPTHALALNILGRASAARFAQGHDPKDAARARQAFNSAIQANPGFWPALQNLGELAEKEGKPEEAAGYYARVLKAVPNHPERSRFEQVIAGAPHRDAGR